MRSASGRSSSAITITPARRPSTPTSTCASPEPWPRQHAPRRRSRPRVSRRAQERAAADRHHAAVDRARDALAGLPTSAGCERERRASAAARTSASPSTCADSRSTDAASRSSSPGWRPSSATMSRTSGSRRSACRSCRRARCAPRRASRSPPAPLTITPRGRRATGRRRARSARPGSAGMASRPPPRRAPAPGRR